MSIELIKEYTTCRKEKRPMFRIIENIVAILGGYGDGKLLASKKKNKFGRRIKDVVSISDEARKRSSSVGEETAPQPVVGKYMK